MVRTIGHQWGDS